MAWHSTLRSYFQPSLSSSLRQNPTLLYSGVAFHLGELLSHSSSSRQDPTPLYSKVASHLNQLLIVAPQGRMLLCYIVEWHLTDQSYSTKVARICKMLLYYIAKQHPTDQSYSKPFWVVLVCRVLLLIQCSSILQIRATNEIIRVALFCKMLLYYIAEQHPTDWSYQLQLRYYLTQLPW